MIRTKSYGTTLVEIVIAIAIGLAAIVPISTMFSQSNRQVTKSQNFSFAAALGRRISQHTSQMPFSEIANVPLPGAAIGGTKTDRYFGALLNPGTDKSQIKYLDETDMPGLCSFLKKYNFKYSVSVSSVTFASDDTVKSVAIYIMWKEGAKDFIYQTHVFISS
ncbi:MAG: hypothetical protein PHF29_07060 [Candidatus Riflebacteria bacterium]|nr:hypothetical protein [Candidatus Riflebacteria bacterium]